MANISKTERLLNVISFLLKERRPAPWSVIRSSVEGYRDTDESDRAVQRRFERDKASIRALGVAIEFVPDDGYGNSGYFIEPSCCFLPRVELTHEEAMMLIMAARATPASGALAAAMNSALSKIEYDSPIPGEIRAIVEEKYLFYHGAFEDDPEEAALLEELCSAVINNKTVIFDYTSVADEKPSERVVDPYGIAFWKGNWYLAGLSRANEEMRVFRLDRMSKNIRLADPGDEPDFEPPADFRVEDHVGRPPWRLREIEKMTVSIKFHPDIAWMVREQSVESDKWSKSRDGWEVLKREVTDPGALIRWLMRFGARAEITSPLEMRERMAEFVSAIRKLYDDRRAGTLGEHHEHSS